LVVILASTVSCVTIEMEMRHTPCCPQVILSSLAALICVTIISG
jgi:hypothetical protein